MTPQPVAELTLHGVRKRYGTTEVLKGFTGTFSRGRVAALVGPNGAGKTTLLRIAAGLQFADEGTVSNPGGLYYGGFDLLPIKARINAFRRSLGLGPVAGGARNLAKLSRGELQQVGLQASFDLEPRVLFLDEPWTALEPDARDELNARIRGTAADRITICSSHDIDEVARVADEVIFLANGIGTLHRREDDAGSLDRDAILASYRESKRR
jgi:ABC-type multidrug transport system ATPase subunit